MSASVLDFVLAAAVVWTAWASLSSRDLFRSVALFIVFGLLMALAWVRLRAPDIALAEAAIGAGLTGALLLDAVAQFEARHSPAGRAGSTPDELAAPGPAYRGFAALAVLAVGAMLALALRELPREAAGLTATVAENLEQSGVAHPVTAVLLNFRALDTWFELGVLLLAVLATLVVRRTDDLRDVTFAPVADPVLPGVARLLVPVMTLAAAYLLWLGTQAPGGAFQAGAVLGSAGVLLLLCGYRSVAALGAGPLRLALAAGVIAFLLAAVGTLLGGRGFLDYPPAHAGTLIVLIEVAVTVSIAVTLTALFAGVHTGGAAVRAEIRTRR